MKNIFQIFIVSILVLFVSCDENQDRFSGSPANNGNFVDVLCTISTTESIVCTVQNFPFTVTLPKAFNFDVNVEATVIGKNLSFRRAIVTVPAGSLTATGTISAPVPVDSNSFLESFTQTCSLSVTGLYPVANSDGFYYKPTSNIVVIKLGDTSVPISNPSRCIIEFDCAGPWGVSGNPLKNNIDVIVKRDGVIFTEAIPPSVNPQPTKRDNTRGERFSIIDGYPDGDYSFEIYFPSLIQSGTLNCRYVISFPTNETKTIEFIEAGLVAPSLPILRLMIKKETSAAGIKYTKI